MNAAAVNKDYRTALYAPNVTKPAIISAVLHIAVFVLATVGIPYLSKDMEPVDMVVPVELFDPSEIIETNAPDEPQKSEEEDLAPPPMRKPVYNNTESMPDLATPEEPELEEIIPEEPPKEVAPDPSIIKTPPKPKSKPKPPKRPEPVQEKPKETEKPERDMTSLLKSLTPDEPEETPNKQNDVGQGKTSQTGNESQQMTSSDLVALVRGVQPCWNVNAGGRYAENLIVKLRVQVNRNRTVRDVAVLDQMRYIADSHFKSAADAARWALLNPQCSTLNLPEDKYETWKSFIFVFDPSQML